MEFPVLQSNARDAAYAHAMASYPNESVGWVIQRPDGNQEFVRGENVHPQPRAAFRTRPQDWADAEDAGEIVAFVHSHPDQPGFASDADRLGCGTSDLPWWVVVLGADGVVGDFWITPEPFEAPLVGRQYVFGVLDCYALVRDWYRTERGITLPDFDRDDPDFWKRGDDVFGRNIEAAGFAPASGAPVVGDVILLRSGSTQVDNCCGVLIEDGLFLHHPTGRLSRRDLYGGPWRRMTSRILRYQTRE